MVVVLLAACGGGADTGTASTPSSASTPRSDDLRVVELAERHGRWEERQPASYRIAVAVQCFCVERVTRPRTMTVNDNDFDFPATIAIDDLVQAIDDEMTYAVTDFEVLDG